ncbi:MAG: gliding motility-associated protein GldE [Chlorobi bacterium]|nr:gliding motility-associated protein GldE [Chlorobiota bacterium]
MLLFSSAMISGSEVAFFSLSPEQKDNLKKENSKKSNLISEILTNHEKLLATILIANNFVNIGIVILTSYILNLAFDFSSSPIAGFIIQIGIITFILLLFGEIIPKVYASEFSVSFAKFTVLPLMLSMKLFSPFSKLLINSTSVVNKRLKMKKSVSPEDLSDALELTEADIKQDKDILERIVTFGSIDVKEIMKPRVDVVAANINFSFNKLKSLIIESGYSRIPIYEENFDNIKGILLIKDLLKNINEENYNWKNIIKPPFFVPDTMKINDLLEEFREKKIHIAIVTDEYGGFSGIVTMEDIIEEIVGEISDETDEENQLFQKIDDNNYIFDGKIQLNDFYKILNIKEDIFEDIRGEADSLAGLILEIKGEIPKKGDVISIGKFLFTIDSANNRKIQKINFKVDSDNA